MLPPFPQLSQFTPFALTVGFPFILLHLLVFLLSCTLLPPLSCVSLSFLIIFWFLSVLFSLIFFLLFKMESLLPFLWENQSRLEYIKGNSPLYQSLTPHFLFGHAPQGVVATLTEGSLEGESKLKHLLAIPTRLLLLPHRQRSDITPANVTYHCLTNNNDRIIFKRSADFSTWKGQNMSFWKKY